MLSGLHEFLNRQWTFMSLDDLTIIDEQHSWQSINIHCSCELWVLIRVNLHNLDLVLKLNCGHLELGSQQLARAAPFRVEVHNQGLCRVLQRELELFSSDLLYQPILLGICGPSPDGRRPQSVQRASGMHNSSLGPLRGQTARCSCKRSSQRQVKGVDRAVQSQQQGKREQTSGQAPQHLISQAYVPAPTCSAPGILPPCPLPQLKLQIREITGC
mmetsp:Transcript_4963/g.7968  ORF Transcript_4963/g.7968 Transcript_4963/m.7968 type:complete len:215 (+) Transcript_4963:190-834(+)